MTTHLMQTLHSINTGGYRQVCIREALRFDTQNPNNINATEMKGKTVLLQELSIRGSPDESETPSSSDSSKKLTT